MRKIASVLATTATLLMVTATSASAANLWSGTDPAGDVKSSGLTKKEKNALDLTSGYIYKWSDDTKVTLQWKVKKFSKTDKNISYQYDYVKGDSRFYAAVSSNGFKVIHNVTANKDSCGTAGSVSTTSTTITWSGIPKKCFPKGKIKFTYGEAFVLPGNGTNYDTMAVNKTVTIR